MSESSLDEDPTPQEVYEYLCEKAGERLNVVTGPRPDYTADLELTVPGHMASDAAKIRHHAARAAQTVAHSRGYENADESDNTESLTDAERGRRYTELLDAADEVCDEYDGDSAELRGTNAGVELVVTFDDPQLAPNTEDGDD